MMPIVPVSGAWTYDVIAFLLYFVLFNRPICLICIFAMCEKTKNEWLNTNIDIKLLN